VEIRILVALDDVYRVYREVIATGIRLLRPHVEVVSAGLEALEERVARLDPHMVICNLPATAVPNAILAWVELSIDPTRPSVVSVGGSRSELSNPRLDALVQVIDEVEQAVGRESHKSGY
jgi:hypothetical protein